MCQLKLFTTLYFLAAILFTVVSFLLNDFAMLYVAFATLVVAILSCFPWWRQTTVVLGRSNVLFGWTVIAILLLFQLYGLISGNFGFKPSLISFIVLMLIATADAINILKESSHSL